MKLNELGILYKYYCEEYPELRMFLKAVSWLLAGLVFLALIIVLPLALSLTLIFIAILAIAGRIGLLRSYEKEEL